MLTLRRSAERGYADHGWLRSFHTFSFAGYSDARFMGFRSLRVINEDRVAPGKGFGTHPHRDMEIVSYVLEGAIEHKDSMGNGSVIRPGDVQRMTAGTGVTHSEKNGSLTDGVHFLQIWILPDRANHTPGYEQKHFDEASKRGRLRLVASSDGREGSVQIHQDASMYAGLFDGDERAEHRIDAARHAWVHVARGSVDLNGTRLSAGDAASTSGALTPILTLSGGQGAEVLVFDLG